MWLLHWADTVEQILHIVDKASKHFVTDHRSLDSFDRPTDMNKKWTVIADYIAERYNFLFTAACINMNISVVHDLISSYLYC